MNLLPPEKLGALEKHFGEGRSVRETARLIGVHRDTVSRYFRLLRDPNPEAIEEEAGPDGVNFGVVEFDNYWHVFVWHDDTPEWWRHIAHFHVERRARDYAKECEAAQAYLVSSDREEAAEVGWPLPDTAPAPETLPAPPASSPVIAAPALTKEERAAERERRWDEEAAALPPRFCSVCEERLTRRPGEQALHFSKRKCCSQEHATLAIQRARQARKVADADDVGSAVADAPEEATQPVLNPPGYRDCPDCMWSGPIREYQDHRRTDH